MKPGRNDPCSCGSGRKYKHCCLAASVAASETPEDLAWRRLRRANEGLIPKLLKFAEKTYGASGIDDAWREFVLWEDESEDWWDTPHASAFLPWMLHHWSPDPHDTTVLDARLHGVPPTRTWLDRQGAQLDPATKRYLQACLIAPFSFHEILDCDPGRGFRAKDLFTGDDNVVIEHSGSTTLHKGDVLFASLVRCDGIVMMEGVGAAVIQPMCKLPILEFRDGLAKDRDAATVEFLRECEDELRTLYLNIVEPILNPAPPDLRNTDGDELSLQQLVFDIDSPQVAFDALKHLALGAGDEELLAGAERAADGALRRVEFQWLRAGNRVHKSWSNTSIGAIEIDGERLSAHVNSDKRAAEFKAIVHKALGERARYRLTEIQSVQHALAEARASDRQRAPSEEEIELAQHPEVKAQLAAMMQQHYEGWVSQKLPALSGRSPLQAVKNPQGREKVAALIDQIERDGCRMTPPLDQSITRRLRERLGLDE